MFEPFLLAVEGQEFLTGFHVEGPLAGLIIILIALLLLWIFKKVLKLVVVLIGAVVGYFVGEAVEPSLSLVFAAGFAIVGIWAMSGDKSKKKKQRSILKDADDWDDDSWDDEGDWDE